MRKLKTINLIFQCPVLHQCLLSFSIKAWYIGGPGSSVSIATGYGLDDPGIESGWGEIFRTRPDRPWGPPSLLYNGYWVFRGFKERPGRDADPSPLLVPWSRKSRVIPILPLRAVRPVQSLSACTVQLYLYTPSWPYSLYRASVAVQYSYTSTPPMDRTACTEPQCLYSTAIPLLPLWAVLPVQSLSACTVQLYLYPPYGPYDQSLSACTRVHFTALYLLFIKNCDWAHRVLLHVFMLVGESVFAYLFDRVGIKSKIK